MTHKPPLSENQIKHGKGQQEKGGKRTDVEKFEGQEDISQQEVDPLIHMQSTSNK